LNFEVFHNFHIFTLNWYCTTVPNFRFCWHTYNFRNTACRLENAEWP